jgi:hypothetical protein
LLYAGLTSGESSAPSTAPPRTSPTSGSSRLKWLFGILFIFGGGLFLVLAVVHACETWKIAQCPPQVATAAELCRKEYIESAPDWISYTFAESKPTQLTMTRQRLGNGGEVEARCLLVRVADQWLVATVAPGFEGNTLVGRLVRLDSPSSRSLMERLGKVEPKASALLPYEFNAVDGCASDQRIRYMAAALIAVFGLLGLWLGLYLLRRGRGSVARNPNTVPSGWAYHPPPVR